MGLLPVRPERVEGYERKTKKTYVEAFYQSARSHRFFTP